jgi:uncharacterized RDD family membrane protein YckC
MEATIYCSKCGTGNLASSQFCQKCGVPLSVGAMPAVSPAYASAVSVPVTVRGYGGFWVRFIAFIVDLILVRVAMIPVFLILGVNIIGWRGIHGRIDPEDVHRLIGVGLTAGLITICAHWLYEATMTSSTMQATVGKLIFQLKVTDEAGNRMSFARATGRHFAKWISAIILWVGFIMAAFTDRKRALHDMIAGTLVVKN